MGCAEAKVESHLRIQVEALGGLCLKQTSHKGLPDRLVVFPELQPWFVELKSETGRLAPAQVASLNSLSAQGFRCTVLSCQEAVDNFIQGVAIELNDLQK